MNWLDIGISITVAIFAFIGLRRGLIREVFSIVALGAAIILGAMFYPYAGDLFIQYKLVKSKAIANAGGFILIIFGTYVIAKLIGRGLSRTIGALHLDWLDKIGGCAFGLVKGVIISSLVISSVGFFFREKGPLFKHSIFLPYINKSYSILKGIIPRDFDKRIEEVGNLIERNRVEPIIKGGERNKETIKQIDRKKESKK